MAALEKENRVLNALSLDHQYRIFAETFCLESDPLAWDLLQLDFLYHQRSFRLPGFMNARLPSNGRPKTWDGDRKTMVVPFRHTLEWRVLSRNSPLRPPLSITPWPTLIPVLATFPGPGLSGSTSDPKIYFNFLHQGVMMWIFHTKSSQHPLRGHEQEYRECRRAVKTV